jgi:carbonic anhydrase
MKDSFEKILQGYEAFREKYVLNDHDIMQQLHAHGQRPKTMIVACCDARVDPALILQCDPGDLFVVRNVANIVPPYERDDGYHGTSAALEFGIRFLEVENLILLGHSQCGGINALLNQEAIKDDDFISKWVSIIGYASDLSVEECAKAAMFKSYENCLTFPWIRERIAQGKLEIHKWYFDIQSGEIFVYHHDVQSYIPLATQSSIAG